MDAIFNFSKPAEGSTVASNRIARFLAKELGLPLVWDGSVRELDLDTLFIVNGAFAFCNCLAALGAAVRMAKQVVWIQQDWTIVPPKHESGAESPFRAAFRERARVGLPGIDWWTTVMKNADATPRSSYVNWNSLTYTPWAAERGAHFLAARKLASHDLLYYGAYRVNREKAFQRYFTEAHGLPITVFSTSKKFRENFGDVGSVRFGDRIEDFNAELASHGLGLYLEDEKSHIEFHSPANRFYEMLGAGLPMVFQPESRAMLHQGGIHVPDGHVVTSLDDLPRLMRKREAIGAKQRELWHADYVGALRQTVKQAYKRLKEMGPTGEPATKRRK